MNEDRRKELKYFAAGASLATLLTLSTVLYRREARGFVRTTPFESQDNFLEDQPIPKELIVSKDNPGVVFGEDPRHPGVFVGKPLSLDSHVSILGHTGSGKSTCSLNLTLEIADGFGVYTDPKKTLIKRYQALHMNSGKDCMVFAPCDAEMCNVWYNVYALLQSDPVHLAAHARQIADILIPQSLEGDSVIWEKTASALATGAIIYCYHLGLGFIETMDWINSLSVNEIITAIMGDSDEEAKVYICKFKDMNPKVIANIAMELESYLAPFSNMHMLRDALTPSKGKKLLDWSLLNGRAPFDTFLVFPESELGVLQPLSCLVVSQLIDSLSNREERTYDETELPYVLVALEEFATLGRLPNIERAMSTLRSRGVTIALYLQSYASLDRIYGKDSARVIRDNLSYQVIMGSNDVESRRYLSDLIGTTPVVRESTSEGATLLKPLGFNFGRSYTEDRVPTVQPQSLQLLDTPIVCTPYGTFLVQKHMALNGDRVFSKPCNHWKPSPCCYGAPVAATMKQEVPDTPSNGATLAEEFQKAKQKLKENSDARRRENGCDNAADLLSGFQKTRASIEDMNDPLLSVLGQFGEAI